MHEVSCLHFSSSVAVNFRFRHKSEPQLANNWPIVPHYGTDVDRRPLTSRVDRYTQGLGFHYRASSATALAAEQENSRDGLCEMQCFYLSRNDGYGMQGRREGSAEPD